MHCPWNGLLGFEQRAAVGGQMRSERSKKVRLELGTSQATGWSLRGHHQSSPLLRGPRMHCNARELSKRYWEKPGELGERVDHYNSSLGQITHVTECILWWRFQRCLLGMPITRMYTINFSAGTLFKKSYHDGILIYRKRTYGMDPLFFLLNICFW